MYTIDLSMTWICFFQLWGIVSASACTLLTATKFDVNGNNYVPPLLILTCFLIGVFTWVRAVFSMNNVSKYREKYVHVSFLFYLYASICWMGTSFASIRENWTLQFITSLSGSLNAWIAFVVMYNRSLDIPTKQQFLSLPNVLVLAGLWELRSFFVNIILVEN
jgi:hypothetical protein